MEITIMIPTKNRPEFILRLLAYYSEAGFQGTIMVGDSSNSSDYIKSSNYISTYSKSLRIEHYYDQSLTADKMISFLSGKVITEFSLMHPDDDIVLVPSLQYCLNFLNKNSEYSAVNGLAFNTGINYNQYTPFGKVTLIKDYPLSSSLADDSFERINDYFSNILNLNMSVIRAAINLKAFSAIEQLNDFDSTYVYGEVIHASVILARGKVKTIDYPYLVRQKHPSQFYRSVSFDDWLKRSDPSASAITLKETLLHELINTSELDDSLLSTKIDELILGLGERTKAKVMAKSNECDFRYTMSKIYSVLRGLSNRGKRLFIKNRRYDYFDGKKYSKETKDALKLYFDVVNNTDLC